VSEPQGEQLPGAEAGAHIHPDHDVFIAAIDDRKRVVLVSAGGDGRRLVRTCAPLDFAPGVDAPDDLPRYHLWDCAGRTSDGSRIVILPAQQIYSIAPTEERFEPADFAPVDAVWRHPRNWGEFS
jgi:hypothetical protein